MSADSASSKIVTDEDWKERVRAENAELERQAGVAKDQPEKSHPSAAGRLPQANFPALVDMFSTQAMLGLGMIAHPTSGKPEPQLQLARHFIDLLGIVEEKTRGNLSEGESALLATTLHFLRMTYVEASGKPAENSDRQSPVAEGGQKTE